MRIVKFVVVIDSRGRGHSQSKRITNTHALAKLVKDKIVSSTDTIILSCKTIHI